MLLLLLLLPPPLSSTVAALRLDTTSALSLRRDHDSDTLLEAAGHKRSESNGQQALVQAVATSADFEHRLLQCSSVSGWSFAKGSKKLPRAHNQNTTTATGCCTLCQETAGCCTWTLNLGRVGRGCNLHGARSTGEMPTHCSECISGSNGTEPLPPSPPIGPPSPPPPGPRPAPPPRSGSIAAPSAQQLKWYEYDRGALITWNPFSHCVDANDPAASNFSCLGCQKGPGKVAPSPTAIMHQLFPRDLNATAIVEVAASFANYALLVVNQRLGFALWDTQANNFSISHTPYRGGGYDVLLEFVQACRRFSVQPGIFYTSHWNAYNTAAYGPRDLTPAEQDDFNVIQLRELMMGKYGSMLELWLDGGLNPSHPKTREFLLHNGDQWVTHGFPERNGIRWVGNENGVVRQPNWGASSPPFKGSELVHGDPYGTVYYPPTADFPMYGGCWMWANHTAAPRSPAELVGRYADTSGQGAKMVLNIAPMDFGALNQTDVAAYRSFGTALTCLYSRPVVNVTFTQGGSMVQRQDSGWELTWSVDRKLTENVTVVIREDISTGQQIFSWELLASADGASWEPVGFETAWPRHRPKRVIPVSIGYRRTIDGVFLGENVSHWIQMKLVVANVTNASRAPALRDFVVYDWMDKSECLNST